MVLRVFFISTTGRRDIRRGQVHVFDVLSSWNFDYEAIDVAAPENENERNFIIERGKKAEDGRIVLPQIYREEQLCGDYVDFLDAIEHEKIDSFLKQRHKQPNSDTKASQGNTSPSLSTMMSVGSIKDASTTLTNAC